MNWLYYFRNKLSFSDTRQPLIQLYLRPFINDENNELLVGEQVVSVDILSLGKAMDLKGKDEQVAKLYFEKLNENEYNIEYLPLSEYDKELYQIKVMLYLNNQGVTMEEVWEWVKKIFILNDYPFETFKEGNYQHFADTNEIMRMFSLKNVQKFEDRLGKDWWKDDGQVDEE